jgi:hypothetical protein
MDVPFIGMDGALGASNGSAGGIGSAGDASDAATAASGLDSQTVEAPGSGLIFQNSYNFDGTFASLTSSEQPAYATDIKRAEYDLSSEFTDSVTINVDFEADDVPLVDGGGFIALNEASTFEAMTSSSYFNALLKRRDFQLSVERRRRYQKPGRSRRQGRGPV